MKDMTSKNTTDTITVLTKEDIEKVQDVLNALEEIKSNNPEYFI